MVGLLNKIDTETSLSDAFKLLKKNPETNINTETALNTLPFGLRYSTQLYFDGYPLTSYARIAITDTTIQRPQIPGFHDGIQYPLESDEVGVRDFTMEHNKPNQISKVYSGLYVRQECRGLKIGSTLIGLTNTVVEDMILRFLRNRPDTLVYGFIVDTAHSKGTTLNRKGWTSYYAQHLGYKSTNSKNRSPKFMKRFPVKQILANGANS